MANHDHDHDHDHDHHDGHGGAVHGDHHHGHHQEPTLAASSFTLAGAHEHVFLGADHARNERRTWIVIALTSAMMVAEIVAGSLFGSMALLADGFHMSTHAGALLIAALAYLYARRHARDDRFSFGTGKFGDLAAFSSAIVLALVAIGIGWESAVRLYHPVEIRFGEAIAVAAVGLAVNLVSAVLLHQGDHGHSHAEGADHHDRNLRAAYVHVLADALTSVLAIAGLFAGWLYGLIWMDAVVGVLGALVIARWSIGLLKASGAVLLDVVPSRDTAAKIRRTLESGGDKVEDLHLWRVGPGHLAAVIAIASPAPQEPQSYKARLRAIAGLAHVNVEVRPA